MQMSTPAHVYSRREVSEVVSASPLWSAWDWNQMLPRPRGEAQRAGLRYESRVTEMFSALDPFFVAQLPFSFVEPGQRAARVVPDGIWFAPQLRRLAICEVKLRHSGDAWHQLTKLYLPVVKKAFPTWEVLRLEVTRWYDPFLRLPEPIEILTAPTVWLTTRTHPFGVFIWSGK